MTGPPLFGACVDGSGGYAAGWLVTAAVVALGTGLLVLRFREGSASRRYGVFGAL